MTKGPFSEATEPSSTPESAAIPPAAWQPFTPRGVAAFASAGFGRIFLLLCTSALLSTGTVVWFLNTAWFPTFQAAIHELPAQVQILRHEMRTATLRPNPCA